MNVHVSNPVVERMLRDELAGQSTPAQSAFAVRNLSVLAYAQGFTLWHYRMTAPIAAASQPGFFDSARDMLAVGDMVIVSGPDGGRINVVAATAPGVVMAGLS